MKIIHAIQMTGMAGAEKHLLELLPELQNAGIEVQLISFYLKEDADSIADLCNPLNEVGIKIHKVESHSRINLSLLRKLKKIIDAEKPDAIHSHLISADGLFSLIKMLFLKKFFLFSTKHNYSYQYTTKFGLSPNHHLFDKFYFTSRLSGFFVNHDLVVSEGLRQLLIAQKICGQDNSTTVYHGLRQQYDPTKNTVSHRHSDHQLVILGRLLKLKGHHHIFNCMPGLIEEFPDLHLNIVGKGPMRKELEAKCAEKGLTDHVTFHGHSSQALDFLRDADVVLMPSSGEGFGLVFLEAFEVGTPVIAFDVAAANEIIENAVNGILVPPFELDKMGKAIQQLLWNKAEGERLVANAKETLTKRFTIEKMRDDTIAVYRKVLPTR